MTSHSDTMFVDTQQELAELLGVAPQTVTAWTKRGIPRTENGRFDVEAVRRWRDANVKRGGDRRPAEVREAALDADGELARFRRAQAIKAEMYNAEKARELVPSTIVNAMLKARAESWSRALDNMPRELSPRLVGKDIRQIEAVLREHKEKLLEIYRAAPDLPSWDVRDDGEVGEDVES